VWNSWTAYYSQVREQDIVSNADWIAARNSMGLEIVAPHPLPAIVQLLSVDLKVNASAGAYDVVGLTNWHSDAATRTTLSVAYVDPIKQTTIVDEDRSSAARGPKNSVRGVRFPLIEMRATHMRRFKQQSLVLEEIETQRSRLSGLREF
jgi:hypothetical protein